MTKPSCFQLRPKDPATSDSRDRYYSPQRDLAYIGPGLLRAAMVSIQEQFIEPWLKDFMEKNAVTEEVLLQTEAPKKLALALNKIINDANPPAALAEVGFSELPSAVQVLIYARIGQVLLAAIWSAVKDVNRPGNDPPTPIADMLQDAEATLRELRLMS